MRPLETWLRKNMALLQRCVTNSSRVISVMILTILSYRVLVTIYCTYFGHTETQKRQKDRMLRP